MPTGTIGTPAFERDVGGAVEQRLHDGPDLRSPSGNSTSGSPASSTSMQRCSASRSAVPRVTGKPPSADSSHAAGWCFHSESLPMNRSRRRVTHDAIGVSMFQRCTGRQDERARSRDVLAPVDAAGASRPG